MSSTIGIAVRILMIENKSFMFCCLEKKSYFMERFVYLRITISWFIEYRFGEGKCVVCCSFMINAYVIYVRLYIFDSVQM